jgi:TRAP-type C4-dicarboxylate transport system permease large subunit
MARLCGRYAAAITAAASTIAPIIPPSIPMVLYALVSDTSIGYLFLGGILPGILMGIVLFVLNTITEIPPREIIAEIWQFIAVLVVALLIMILVPEVVLWLPQMFGYARK